MVDERQRGIAPIKQEFIVQDECVIATDDHLANTNTDDLANDDASARPAKRQRLSGRNKPALARKDRHKSGGANKGRHTSRACDEVDLCIFIARDEQCSFGMNCKHPHDLPSYLLAKPRDIYWPIRMPPLYTTPAKSAAESEKPRTLESSIDFGTTCPRFIEQGSCPYGHKCRFLGGHTRKAVTGPDMTDTLPLVNANYVANPEEINTVGTNVLKSLRSRKYLTPQADKYLKHIEEHPEGGAPTIKACYKIDVQSKAECGTSDVSSPKDAASLITTESCDIPDVPFRPCEKRRLHWSGLTYLAPLTTVGNLPFRRLATSLGADITCSEMALANSLLQGSREEWSLVRRHPSERTFGVQVAGSKIAPLARCAEVLAKEVGSSEHPGIDFVDINCGCPIDLVFRTGAGAALLDSPGKLGKIINGMNRSLGAIPLTIKVRTGVKDGKNTSHKLMSRLPEWGVSAMTIHGRTRQQRYTKLADWSYIRQCVETLREHTKDEDLPSIPIFGGGDVYSSQAYWDCLETYGVDGVMIGRGALIKPWIFTEIKEHREWDISARERLDLIRQYVDHGLNHWGSDTMGLNTTRRFLCEALSFQHRYIPIGLLEVMPGRINDRPPKFRGRDELETLLSSTQAADWVKISEMFLGPAPENWTFIPKHKSNAVEGNG